MRRLGLASKLSRYYFSSAQMADWQYVVKIHKSLKQNNINEAIKYLINSHLDGIILDRQTFHNIHQKMNQAKSALSYQQLAYKLYRQNFAPHILTAQWMKSLLQSKDKKTLQLIKKDYQTLRIQVPKILMKKIENQNLSQQLNILDNCNKQQPVQGKDTNRTKTSQIQKQQKNKNSQRKESSIKQDNGDVQFKKIERNRLQNLNLDISNLNPESINLAKLEQMINLINKNNWKIVIHNLELQFDSQFDEGDLENQMEMNEDLQEDKVDQMSPAVLVEALAAANKVKVQKIEIIQSDKQDPTANK